MNLDHLERPSDDLVVATPELVTFDYQLAGIGSRLLAQLIDFPLQVLLIAAAIAGGLAGGALLGSSSVATLAALVSAILLVWGYPIVSEAVWSGQTVGKKVFGLRVVGDQGEPLRVSQSIVRNLVRVVDFLPGFYGLGLVVLFLNGRGKRLGDLAAGTVVVRERAPMSLHQLTAAAAAAEAAPEPFEHPLLRALDVDLRRFLQSYAHRRRTIDPWRRHVLASAAAPALEEVLPAVVRTRGPAAALEELADLFGSSPPRPF